MQLSRSPISIVSPLGGIVARVSEGDRRYSLGSRSCRRIASAIAKALPQCRQGICAYDAFAGNGILTGTLAADGRYCEIYASDADPEAVSKTRSLIEAMRVNHVLVFQHNHLLGKPRSIASGKLDAAFLDPPYSNKCLWIEPDGTSRNRHHGDEAWQRLKQTIMSMVSLLQNAGILALLSHSYDMRESIESETPFQFLGNERLYSSGNLMSDRQLYIFQKRPLSHISRHPR